MKLPSRFVAGLCLLFSSQFVLAESFDARVESLVRPWANALSNIIFYKIDLFGQGFPLIVLWLAIAAVFFTLYMGFLNIRGFALAVRHVRGEFHNPDAKGEISHFQAVATAISGTVGIGNIGGVAVAIVIGGPGAAFWLMVAGFLSMSTKMVECTLGVKYRKHNPDGSVSGGPMYYLEHYLASRGAPRWGKLLGGFYALSLVIGCFGIGNMFQSNQAFQQFVFATGGSGSFFANKGWLFGVVLAVIVAMVIVGGIKSIGRVTSKLVPFMALAYIIGALLVILLNAEKLPGVVAAIVTQAFNPSAISGGMLGVMILGFQRAAFSNEAGLGSAAIVHSAVRTNEPVTEGFVGLMEPFIDTVVICTLTALVILTTVYEPDMVGGGIQGIELTSQAFRSTLSWSTVPLSFIAILFAFSTMLSWSYYGLKGWTYLIGESKRGEVIFKLVFCAFGALGCMIQLDAVLDFSDALVFVIALPNIFGLYVLAPIIKRELKGYQARLKSGEIKNLRETNEVSLEIQ
jgi:AGCS family alanine or glycine:cation symporter